MASDLPDQARLVKQYNAGWVVSLARPEFIARLRAMSRDDLEQARPGVERIGREMSWEREAEQLLAVYGQVLGQERVAV